MTDKEQLLFTIQEASEIASISPSLIKKLARQQRLTIVRIGRLVRVPRHELLRLCGVADPAVEPSETQPTLSGLDDSSMKGK